MAAWVDFTEACYGGHYTSRPEAEKSGVYAIFRDDGKAVYVGSTNRLGRRLKQHRVEFGGVFVYSRWGHFKNGRIKLRICRDYQYREARLIRRLRPIENLRAEPVR